MTKNRIYAVTLNPDRVLPIASLVRASSPAVALRHVTRKVFDCEVASQDDLVELLQRQVQVEDANEQTSGSDAGAPEVQASDHHPVSGRTGEDSAQTAQLDIDDIPRCLDRRRNRVGEPT